MKDLFKKVFFNIIPKAFLIACSVDIVIGFILGIILPNISFIGIFLMILAALLAIVSILLFVIITTIGIVSLKHDSVSKNKLILFKTGILLLIYTITFFAFPYAYLTLMIPCAVTSSLREKVVTRFEAKTKPINAVQPPTEGPTFYQESVPTPKKQISKPVVTNEDIKFDVDSGRCRKLTAKWNPPYVDTIHNVTFKVIVSPHGQTEILKTSSSGNKEFDNSAQVVLFSMRNNVAQCLPYGQAGHTFLTFSSCPRFKVVMSD